MQLRYKGVVSLCKAAKISGAEAFLHQSIVWTVRPRDGHSFDENSDEVDARLNDYIEGEQAVLKFTTLRTAILRLGLRKVGFPVVIISYGAESNFTQRLAANILREKVPIVGDGENQVSLVHVDDVASAFVTAAEQLIQKQNKSGIYHVIGEANAYINFLTRKDDEPVSMADLLNTIAEQLGATAPYSVSEWMARLAARYCSRKFELRILSGDIIDFLTSSTITSNEKFKKTFGWKPKYPSLKQGLPQVLEEWKKSKLDLNSLQF